MPNFQIKDLTVTVASKNLHGYTPQFYCHWGCSYITPICRWQGCTFLFSPIDCFGCSFRSPIVDCGLTPLGCTPTFDTFKDRTWQEVVLPNLKRTELEELRASIGDLQSKIEIQLKQTPEDLDLLEGKLKEALEEVAKQRGNTPNG